MNENETSSKQILDLLLSNNPVVAAEGLRLLATIFESGNVGMLSIVFQIKGDDAVGSVRGEYNEGVYYKMKLLLDHVDEALKASYQLAKVNKIHSVPMSSQN